ncbi:MAG: nucleoid-associated protein [Chitinophagaceae bacterium]|nr:MAG: nucleoid-associated protein [Chitinophagaceae bacterium]
MLDYSGVTIETLSVHHVGNKTNNEDLLLSEEKLPVSDPRLKELLIRFFLPHFSEAELYAFTFTEEKFDLNPLYNYAREAFEDYSDFHNTSITIARHLYEVAVHPQIKPGDLFVAYFSGLILDGQELEAIGIFKSENKQPFLDVDSSSFTLRYDEGINIDKLDKACLIFNEKENDGLRVSVIDKKGNADALYWTNSFLHIKPISDAFHNTQQFLSIAKEFVTKQVTEEFVLSKPDQIDLLNRSIDYFKTHSEFDKAQFEEEVFHHPEMINSFRTFDGQYRNENDLEIGDSFSISSQAVKKQARAFKSVLKLDNNFHVYIHGDKTLIERGIDHDGRKYYKIYYETEK